MNARALALFTCLAHAFAAGAMEAPLRVPGKPVTHAAKARMAPGGFRDSGYPQTLASSYRLSAPDASARDETGEDTKRTRIGMRRNLAPDESMQGGPASLQWAAAPAGGKTARLQVTSSEARALRIGLRVTGLPPGAELRFAGDAADRDVPAADAARVAEAMRVLGVFWTPATEGDSQTVEFWIPPGADASATRVEIESVSHLGTSAAARFKSAGVGAAQSCHENVACLAHADPAIAQAARAVARLLYTDNGSTYLCTGTLINDGDPASQVPYLYTAAHCIGSQAAASSLETYWFFEAPDCASAKPGAYRQLSAGATLLYANDATDVAILRLRDPAPEGAWFAGWDATPVAPGTALLALHHPAGDLKKAALGVSLALSSNVVASWSRGSTEGGSSGSGAFTSWNGEYFLRGGLRGGAASCSNSGRMDDASNRDFYSRLDLEADALRKTLALPGAAPRLDGLWWNPAEPGWGLSIARGSADRAFVTWYTYDGEGRPTWLAMPDAALSADGALQGTLYRATGSEAGRPYDPARFSMEPVGTARIDPRPEGATFSAAIGARSLSTPIQRLGP